MTEAAAIEEALGGVISALRADGYDLVIDESGERLAMRIVASDGACADCLSPPAVLQGIVAAAVGGRYAPEQIAIRYPSSP